VLKKNIIRTLLVITSLLSIWAYFGVRQVMQVYGILPGQIKWLLLCLFFLGCAFFALVLFALTWVSRFVSLFQSLRVNLPSSAPGRSLFLVLSAIILLSIAGCLLFLPAFSTAFAEFNNTGIHWWLLFIACIGSALSIKAGVKEISFERSLILSFLGEALVIKLVVFLSHISATPFSLSWEESYRLYIASLVAAWKVYGVSVLLFPDNYLFFRDFSLNLINGIPFLMGKIPIIVIRCWFVILGIGITFLTAALFARRLKIQDRLIRWMFISWLFLFLLQEGGIKYNLLICVAIIFTGVSGKHPWRSLISISIASIWAGMSRINWYPVPAMLAICLFLLEEPVDHYKEMVHYLVTPILWAVIGISSSFLPGFFIPEIQLGTASSFTSALLWYRLLPNPTYPPGILVPILIVSIPLLWICVVKARGRIHPIRVAGLTILTMILFIGGIVVSLKIGGGSDLHNLDAYLAFLATISSYFFFNRLANDQLATTGLSPWPIIALTILFPIISATQPSFLVVPKSQGSADQTLQSLKYVTEQAARRGEVLFMYQRQLLTFGYIDTPLVAKYENVEVMEDAMSSNQSDLSKFYEDLRQHQFSLIVTENLARSIRGSMYPFGEENDIWFTRITQPILCFYRLVTKYSNVGIEIYAPRPSSETCNAAKP
jgi:hypothetical protein